jgi:hypothetical protein
MGGHPAHKQEARKQAEDEQALEDMLVDKPERGKS